MEEVAAAEVDGVPDEEPGEPRPFDAAASSWPVDDYHEVVIW